MSLRHRIAPLIATLVIAAAAVGCAAGPGLPTGVPGATDSRGCPTSQPPALPAGQTRTVTIRTSLGSIVMSVRGDLAPLAAGNFVALAACGFYDGVVFHRAASLPDGTPFVIQGGDPTGTGAGGPGYTIRDEAVTTPYVRGTVAMARSSAPNSEGSQFFIVLSDAAGGVLASYNTYAIFGEVTDGMATADAIFAAADAELPSHPIAMESVTVSTP